MTNEEKAKAYGVTSGHACDHGFVYYKSSAYPVTVGWLKFYQAYTYVIEEWYAPILKESNPVRPV